MTDNKTVAIGDVVMLKSGGPKMTVVGTLPASEYRPEPQWNCNWFADDGCLCSGLFVAAALEKLR